MLKGMGARLERRGGGGCICDASEFFLCYYRVIQ